MKIIPEINICTENIRRCFLTMALLWSLCIILFLSWGLWMEFHDTYNGAVNEARVHSWRWTISLGLIWLFVLFFLGLGVRKITANIRALRQISSELVANEQQSSQQKALFEAIFNSITDAVIVTDSQKRIIMVNQSFTDLTGFTHDESMGKTMQFLFFHPDVLLKSLNTVNPVPREMECRVKEGDYIPVEAHCTRVKAPGGLVIDQLIVLRDISRRKAAEEQHAKLEAKLRQACKMEAIGTLAGGIAHDFNNILGIIFVNTDLALDDIPYENPARTNIQRIVQASTRARDLVKQILAYSRRADQKLIPLMPGPLVKESLQFLRSTIPASVTVEQHINDGFRTILMDPAQIQQLLVNLFANAVQAMREKGTVKVNGAVVELSEDDVSAQQNMMPGHYFRLSVSDTGAGMDPATQERIFDPFYTTREIGEGTGMGLSAVMGIVRSHGGHITVDSEPGSGTTVQILFPVVTLSEEQDEGDEGLQGTERVLFVDDEQMLIEMAGIFLRRQGYIVTEITESREALAAFRSRPDDFDIVVTDYAMPEMTGSELAAELLKIRPDIPIILLSGYAKKISEEDVRELGVKEFLYKPFDGKTLARSMRKVLDKLV